MWLLGGALMYQDKVPEGIAIFEAVLAQAPDFGQARVDLARAYCCDGGAAARRAT